MRGARRSRIAERIALIALGLWLLPTAANATLRYRDIQISGNIETQNLFRIQNGSDTFSAFNPVQQRNTFRLQYEHKLAEGGDLLSGAAQLPLINRMSLFAYYRFVYDSIYDIAPGPFLESQEGAHAGKIGDLANRDRFNVGSENALREVYLDVGFKGSKLGMRIGRQQIVWGEALDYQVLDSVQATDLSWHWQQETGLFGKVGIAERRIPNWAVKFLYKIGDVGQFTNVFAEAYDIPFEFHPTKFRFLPAPWSFPQLNPFRAGLTLNLSSGLLLQPCFDMTGNSLNDSDSTAAGHAPDYSKAAETGFCNSANLRTTNFRHGLYDSHDPSDVNQVGVRLGAVSPVGIGFTLEYLYRRELGIDIPQAGIAKVQVGALTADPTGFINLSPHDTTDPAFRDTQSVLGYVRLPTEVYYPYVHVVGASLNYTDEEYTQAAFTAETAWTHDLPVTTLNPFGNGLKKKDVFLGAVNFDRPTWIRWLNRRATWLIVGQLNYVYIVGHDKIRQVGVDQFGSPQFDGDVGSPSANTIPRQFGAVDRIDRLKEIELLSVLAASSFYRGGTVVPFLAWVNDWQDAPSMEFIASVDLLPTNNIIITPALRIFTNFGRIVDDPWGIGRASQWDEVQLKATYQF